MNRFSISRQQLENSAVKTIGVMVYPGVEIIDVVGPMEVFVFANKVLQNEGLISDPVYNFELLGKDANPITSLSGLQIGPVKSYAKFDRVLDTLIVPGGNAQETIDKDPALIDWIQGRADSIRRVASICTGAFLLAEAGLFEGRLATTHWFFSSQFMNRYPSVDLDPNRIFIQDGPVWSSGGVTSGIDLGLAMLESDWGHKLALHIARFMVVFLKRQGGQSQYSDYLKTDAINRRDIRELQSWIIENIQSDLRVEALAGRVAMSARNFARVFRSETGVTPAKYVETVRVDLVRHYLESTRLNMPIIAQKVGFKDADTMRKVFVRHVGASPIDYRTRFGNACDQRVIASMADRQKPTCTNPVVLEHKLGGTVALNR